MTVQLHLIGVTHSGIFVSVTGTIDRLAELR